MRSSRSVSFEATAESGWLSQVTNWQAMCDVYGSAADIPALLDAAASATDWDAPAWRVLWLRLCHQGSVAPASYAALPALARIAESRADLALDPALFLAASIIASKDGPPEISDVRNVYAAQITALRPVAEYKLELVRKRPDVLYALEVVAAFEDLSIWQRDLDRLVNEEVELDCPSCNHYIYLGLVDGALVATADRDAVGDGLPVQPADPGGLGAAEARLLALCRAHNHAAVSRELLQLFGQATCPHCGATFSVADAMA